MNSKFLVLTLCIGDDFQPMAAISHPRMKEYADKIGADFEVISEKKISTTTCHWEKFQIYNLLAKYERIIFIDTDIIIRKDAPNLLSIVPPDCLGAFNEALYTPGRGLALGDICKAYNTPLTKWDGKYFNTGLMVISRCHREIFKKPVLEISNFYEQSYLNLAIARLECKTFSLDYHFNRMTCMDGLTGEERFASYFIHYAGCPDRNYATKLMKDDTEKWDEVHPNYLYQRHILIDVQGGLGDQVDAEPAIRFLKNYVYPNDDVVVKAHWPRLFEHLDLPVTSHSDFKASNDTPYYHVVTLPGLETIQWRIVSNLLCHTVDFCAMALMRRILPIDHKQIHLNINECDQQEVKNLLPNVDFSKAIIVHPGKHWESKTFPKQYWQDIVNGLHSAGKQVIIIGKDEATRGAWDLELKEGMIDVRNLLSLGGLIYLISVCSCLVSNDSAPIHIAGAFDNKIVLLPSCKHPDHVLPYRGLDRNYKQISLYKKLTLDDCGQAPTLVDGASAEFIKETWDKYLLDPKEVVEKIIKFL